MNEIKALANDFLEIRENVNKKRRYIDYNMAQHLTKIEENKDGTVESTLAVIKFKSEMEAEESHYSELQQQLVDITKDLKPLLVEVNATRDNPLITHVEGRTYHDTYLDENRDVQNRGLYTDTSK